MVKKKKNYKKKKNKNSKIINKIKKNFIFYFRKI
jgi:hypothetical protein